MSGQFEFDGMLPCMRILVPRSLSGAAAYIASLHHTMPDAAPGLDSEAQPIPGLGPHHVPTAPSTLNQTGLVGGHGPQIPCCP